MEKLVSEKHITMVSVQVWCYVDVFILPVEVYLNVSCMINILWSLMYSEVWIDRFQKDVPSSDSPTQVHQQIIDDVELPSHELTFSLRPVTSYQQPMIKHAVAHNSRQGKTDDHVPATDMGKLNEDGSVQIGDFSRPAYPWETASGIKWLRSLCVFSNIDGCSLCDKMLDNWTNYVVFLVFVISVMSVHVHMYKLCALDWFKYVLLLC